MIEKGWIEATRMQNRQRAVDAVISMSDALRLADAEIDRLMRELGETEDALAACQSQAGGLLRAIRNDIEAAYNGLDYLTNLRVAAAADPNGNRRLAIDAAEIRGRLLQHMKRIDDVVATPPAREP
jgi:hypothetical protein